MVVKIWHLALPLLVVLVAGAFYLGRSSAHPAQTVSPEVVAQEKTTNSALRTQLAEMQNRQESTAAQATVRAVLLDIESYSADNGGYQGMTASMLKSSYDQQIQPGVWIIGSSDVSGAAPPTGTLITSNGVLSKTNYCVVAQSGGWYAWKHGPGGAVLVSTDKNQICG